MPSVAVEHSSNSHAADGAAVDLPVEPVSLRTLCLRSLKRTRDLFVGNHGMRPSFDEASQRIKLACKIHDEYAVARDMPPPSAPTTTASSKDAQHQSNGAAAVSRPAEATGTAPAEPAKEVVHRSNIQTLIDKLPEREVPQSTQLVEYKKQQQQLAAIPEKYMPSAQIMKRLPSKWPKPVWHPPWKMYRVISGHLGWVRSVAVDPSNQWFATGAADRTIKARFATIDMYALHGPHPYTNNLLPSLMPLQIWDLASGQLRLTLTGHIEQIRGLAVSPRHPYMFSAGDDKQVKCWDLEYNKVIRHYHGHLSGVYCLALHPTLDVLMTGGRDSVCRVWDMRTKAQIFALAGHQNTVCSVIAQPTDPQVITGSHDSTVKMWDLATGKSMSTLTYHKKSVRAMAMHPTETTFVSASADNMKKFRLPRGDFMHNMLGNQRTILNCMAVNEDGVLASGGDNGSLWFWDWKSGHNFQQGQTVVQPGSLDSESGIFACGYDVTGTRLITCEADKTIKMWREDENATPETHPVNFKIPKETRRF
eukprot:jgi/Chlat1/8461/Chrsp80S07927